MDRTVTLLLLCLLGLALFASPAAAFGAGNIASISKLEGHNWRHGDIEDLLATVAFIKGHKFTNMMIKRTYFGNWLRDYSQAVDVGTLKGVPADTIRVLVWILAFMSFGYATAEFEVTAERLGVYRPEEHIDNPKDYADNQDARQFDPRLRGPVAPIELEIDPNTGMKNYIANEQLGIATSLGYVKWTFARSIHFGRLYCHGTNRGREEDLCEALRCLGQGLHCMEDFGAHTNYTELALRELGFHNVFPHVGAQASINLQGKQVFPLVTGTFGGVDFLHSVLGEATDHVSQAEVNETEVDQLNAALSDAQASGRRESQDRSVGELSDLLSKVPGTGGLIQEAQSLQSMSDAQAQQNTAGDYRGLEESYVPYGDSSYGANRADPSQSQQNTGSNQTSTGFQAPPSVDPAAVIKKIYPILAFRDKVVRQISAIVSKIPGLEKLIDTITEKVTLFVMGLLAPFVKPLIASASTALKQGSGTVVSSSARQQYLVWTDPTSSDPTHSMLSKDHFSNILNEPAGEMAACVLQYVAPRIIYGWEHPEVPEDEILADISRVFHHPATRDPRVEIHQKMFDIIQKWVNNRNGGQDLNNVLSSESVKAGKNHHVQNVAQSFQGLQQLANQHGFNVGTGTTSHSATSGGVFDMLSQRRARGGDIVDPTQYSHAPVPASYDQQNEAYPTAYQQGYEAPWQPQQSAPSQYQGEYNQSGYEGGYAPQQGGYEQQPGGYNEGYGSGGYNQQRY